MNIRTKSSRKSALSSISGSVHQHASRAILAAAAAVALSGSLAHAQTLVWDPDSNLANPNGGAGTWNTTSPSWRTTTDTYVNWLDDGNGIAEFPLARNSAGAVIAPGNVTIPTGETRVASGLVFSNSYYDTTTTPANGGAYGIVGGTLELRNAATITMANFGTLVSTGVGQPQSPIVPQVINSNLVVANGGGLTVLSNYSQTTSPSVQPRTQLSLGGTNTFSSLTIGGTGTVTAFTSGNYVGITSANGLPTNANVNFGKNFSELFLAASAGSPTYTGTWNLNSSNSGTTQNAAIGVNSAAQTMTISGKITGRGTLNVQVGTGASAGGAGILVLSNPDNDYTGSTFLHMNSSAVTSGLLRLGIADALPTTTDVVFNAGSATAPSGGLDLAGFNQSITGLRSVATNTSTSISPGIVNTGAPATLTINGARIGAYAFNIGSPQVFTSTPSAFATANDHIALNLPVTNSGTLTLSRLAGNTYADGTTINGGTVLLANTSGSGTGSGAVTVGAAGKLGGTPIVFEGAVYPSGSVSGPVTSAGTILPGGTGGIGKFAFNGAFTAQPSSNLDFDFQFDTPNAVMLNDSLTFNGAVTLPGTAQSVNLNLTDLGGLTDGTYTIINYADGSSLETVNTTASGPLKVVKPATGAASVGTFVLNNDSSGNAISVTISGVADRLVWNTGTGTWDTGITANFNNRVTLAPSVFTNNDEVLFDDTTTGSDDPVVVTVAGGGVTTSRVVIDGARNYTFIGGPISGAANIVKSGSGTVTLGTNSHTGGTSATSGILHVTSDASFGAVPASPTANVFLTKQSNTNGTTLVFDAPMTIAANRTVVIGVTGGSNGPVFDTGANDVTIAGNITGSTGVNLMKTAGSGALILRGDNSTASGGGYIGSVFINAGTLDIIADNALGRTVANGNTDGSIQLNGGTGSLKFSQAFTWAGRTINFGGSGGNLETPLGVSQTINSPIVGASIFNKTGAGTLTLDFVTAHTGVTNVNAGTLVAANADALGSGAVTVNATGTLQAKPGLAKALNFNSLTIAGGATPTGTVDLTDGAMVVRGATLATHTTVTDQVKYAFDEFAWDRPGITSTTVAADIQNGLPTTLGILFNNDTGGNALFYGDGGDLPLFEGRSVNADTVLVKYTLLGDGDLNGTVDSVDFALFQAGFDGSAPYTGFAFGDYNYDGFVDSVDFGLFQAGFDASQPLTQPMLAAAIAEFAAANGLTLGATAVPEPASLGVLGLAACGMLARRRRA